MEVDRTKAETSRNHHDMTDFPLTQDQPVDSDVRTSRCATVIHHQWHQVATYVPEWNSDHFLPAFCLPVRLSVYLYVMTNRTHPQQSQDTRSL